MNNKTVSRSATTSRKAGEQRYRQQKPFYIPVLAVCGSVCFCQFAYRDCLYTPGNLVIRLPVLAVLLFVAVHEIGQWFRIRNHNNRATEELNRELNGTAYPVLSHGSASRKGMSGRTLTTFSLGWWGIGVVRVFLTFLFLYLGLGWSAQNESFWLPPMEEDSLTEMIVIPVLCLLILLLSYASGEALTSRIRAGLGFTDTCAE